MCTPSSRKVLPRLTGTPRSAASQPMRMTSVTAPWTLRMSVAPASIKRRLPAASRYSPELISVHGAPWRRSRRPSKSERRIGSSTQNRSCPARRIASSLVSASLAPQASLASIMMRAPAADGLAEEIQAMQVALEVGMADLDLEGRVADRVGVPEQRDEGVVGEMEIEPAGIGGDAIAAAAEVAPEGKVRLLGGEVPKRLLQGFVEGQRKAALVAAARTSRRGGRAPPAAGRRGRAKPR